MKNCILFSLMVMAFPSFSQDYDSGMKAFAAEKYHTFLATDEAKKVEMSSGDDFRYERHYAQGESSVKLEINRTNDPAKLKKDIGQIMNMMKEIETNGMAIATWVDEDGKYGFLGYMASAKKASIAIIFNENYFLSVSIENVSGIEIAEKIYSEMDFSVLK